MKHNVHGKAAENAVAESLKKNGYEILAQNWKTRWCEIDVIALKHSCVHFVEVKYRSRSSQGAGFDYVKAAKLPQMKFAAEFSGPDFQIHFIEEM